MIDIDKILVWVEENRTKQDNSLLPDIVSAKDLNEMLIGLKNPPKKLVWHYRTKDNMEWRVATDEEYERGQHLARFEWKQFEV